MLDKNFERRPFIAEILKDSWVQSMKKIQKKSHKNESEEISLCT